MEGSAIKPAIYHCISRVVDRRFVLGDTEREQFRMFMRMQENFSGCRVLAYCIMSNHFHCRVRYFTDGAVIGSRKFVNEAFAKSRERFGPRRKDGARRMRGSGSPANGFLWSVRDLRTGI